MMPNGSCGCQPLTLYCFSEQWFSIWLMTDDETAQTETKTESVRTQLGRNIKRVRQAIRQMTVRDLSARLEPLGLKLSHSGISEIENATRKVSVDELLKIAIALNTSVIDLILPGDWETLRVADCIDELNVEQLYGWLRGDRPWPNDASPDDFWRAARHHHREMLLWNQDPVMQAVFSLESVVRLSRSQDARSSGTYASTVRDALDDVNRKVAEMIERIEESDDATR
jgi:transcriptional regulator with XRE-family HTH domain